MVGGATPCACGLGVVRTLENRRLVNAPAGGRGQQRPGRPRSRGPGSLIEARPGPDSRTLPPILSCFRCWGIYPQDGRGEVGQGGAVGAAAPQKPVSLWVTTVLISWETP